jgi:predicted aspartyl protease
MITGRIDENLEARIVLPVVVGDTTTDVEFLLDTGFSGFLAVSALLVQQCDLPLRTV